MQLSYDLTVTNYNYILNDCSEEKASRTLLWNTVTLVDEQWRRSIFINAPSSSGKRSQVPGEECNGCL